MIVAVGEPVKCRPCCGQFIQDLTKRPARDYNYLRPSTDLKNIQVAPAAGGAQLEHVIKWNLYVVQGQSIRTGFEVFQRVWANRLNPPAISVLFVSGLAHPDFLLEMDAIAVVPQ